MFVVTSNSSKVAPYVWHMNLERVAIGAAILVLATGSYALGWGVARVLHQDKETTISMNAQYQRGSGYCRRMLSWSSHVPGDDRNAVPTGVSGVLWQGAGI